MWYGEEGKGRIHILYILYPIQSVGFRPQIDYQHDQWLLEINCMLTVTKYICYWNVIVEI